jgi:hypothetical protein
MKRVLLRVAAGLGTAGLALLHWATHAGAGVNIGR